MSSDSDSNEKITFNSMVAVLQRLDKITNFINLHRSRGNYKVMHGYMVDYYKELVGDLTDKELKETWKDLIDVKKYLNAGNDLPIHPKAPRMLDEIDINLRLMAKAHGYLTTNQASLSSRLIS